MSLKTKCLLRDFCRYVYFAGAGNCWDTHLYEETTLYTIYSVITFTIYVAMIILENVAVLFGDFPEVEQNSAVMFSAIHNIVLIKMFLLLYHKKSIRKLNHEMAAVGENFEERPVMENQYRKVKIGICLYIVSVYLSLIAYGVESSRKSLVEGAPFYTVVTYYPFYQDESNFASFLRIFFYITWLYMMLPMMSTDCLPITHLIVLTYKFITLRHHFERIREKFDRNSVTNKKRAIQELKEGFLEGVKMHQKLLVLAEEIHRIFGIIMSLQVCESSAVAVLLLLRLALSPHLDLTNAFMTYTFVGSLFLLLALNLWNAGEITYQASLLSSAMFYCGWHMCDTDKRSQRALRRWVLIGCAQAQKPLILKAFGAPFYTVVTYYPFYQDESNFASFLRIFFYITWLYMMLPMMSTDCLPITHLIVLTYKFITLRHHFERIREKFDRNSVTNKKRAIQELKEGFLEGVKMHQKLLVLAEEIHRIFGIIMSLQVCESSAVAVLLLLRLALSPHLDLTNAFMTYTFVGSLFLLLALNLWNAGEITYQASLLSSAMFYCGWHMCDTDKRSQRALRRWVLIGCAQAQKPLILKAFGIQDLSYETFVSVARMTYSIFAVFYQRGD